MAPPSEGTIPPSANPGSRGAILCGKGVPRELRVACGGGGEGGTCCSLMSSVSPRACRPSPAAARRSHCRFAGVIGSKFGIDWIAAVTLAACMCSVLPLTHECGLLGILSMGVCLRMHNGMLLASFVVDARRHGIRRNAQARDRTVKGFVRAGS